MTVSISLQEPKYPLLPTELPLTLMCTLRPWHLTCSDPSSLGSRIQLHGNDISLAQSRQRKFPSGSAFQHVQGDLSRRMNWNWYLQSCSWRWEVKWGNEGAVERPEHQYSRSMLVPPLNYRMRVKRKDGCGPGILQDVWRLMWVHWDLLNRKRWLGFVSHHHIYELSVSFAGARGGKGEVYNYETYVPRSCVPWFIKSPPKSDRMTYFNKKTPLFFPFFLTGRGEGRDFSGLGLIAGGRKERLFPNPLKLFGFFCRFVPYPTHNNRPMNLFPLLICHRT